TGLERESQRALPLTKAVAQQQSRAVVSLEGLAAPLRQKPHALGRVGGIAEDQVGGFSKRPRKAQSQVREPAVDIDAELRAGVDDVLQKVVIDVHDRESRARPQEPECKRGQVMVAE